MIRAVALGLMIAAMAHAENAPGTLTINRTEAPKPPHLAPEETKTDGSVQVGGAQIDYQAVAGTLVVHPKGWDDATPLGDAKPSDAAKPGEADKNPTAEASMFYTAYFKHGAEAAGRPITFLFNGGPGSATVWLHMGAFGPLRVVTTDGAHSPAAPYRLVNNEASLLDASDLVFIDAPGAGFSRIAGKDKEKAFYGIDADAYAFAEFITAFLSKFERWNSPKYLFGESYGTTRAAVLANMLTTDRGVDLNGVIMLSQILAFDLSPDGPETNPGIDLPYQLALPTYAATAWYHHRLDPRFTDLPALLSEVERFAMGDYAAALAAGATLDPARRDAIAAKLHDYTGLPLTYIERANLRVDGGEFEQNLQGDHDVTTGRLDTRFSGPAMDPLGKEADYDPQSAAIASAYVAGFNDYVRRVLKYGEGKTYKLFADVSKTWSFKHQPPGADQPLDQSANVMPDLAHALKYDPVLKVQLNAGYFDLATPYYQGVYEMQHLPIPPALQANIEYRQYQSGHMVYANADALQALHDNVAGFIARTTP